MPQKGLIERGRTSEEEYQRLSKQAHSVRFSTQDGEEVFWGIPLNDTYFVFCNNILEFYGHHIVGRVGVHKDRKLLRQETVEYFIKIDEKERNK